MIDAKILQDHIDEINRIIYSYLPESDGINAELADAVSYSVKAGGKRLRPMLIRETYRLFAEGRPEPEILYAFMAAIEFIHTYSLIHDDLPAMDNDEYRRGQLTTHAKYGEAAGILAGDALLNLAFETILAAIEGSEEPDDYMGGISAGRVLAEKAGMFGMIGGQYVDVYSEKHEDFTLNEQQIRYIYKNKTSALLEASVMIGAILGSAADLEIDVMEKMAEYIGLAFQIQDDILDITGDPQLIGKPVGSDEKNQKQTYVSMFGLDAAREAVNRYTEQSLKILDSIRHRNPFLRELIKDLSSRNK